MSEDHLTMAMMSLLKQAHQRKYKKEKLSMNKKVMTRQVAVDFAEEQYELVSKFIHKIRGSITTQSNQEVRVENRVYEQEMRIYKDKNGVYSLWDAYFVGQSDNLERLMKDAGIGYDPQKNSFYTPEPRLEESDP